MPAYRVSDMSCEACVRALTAAVRSVDGQAALSADLAAKRVEVASGADPAALAHAMTEAGFSVEAV